MPGNSGGDGSRKVFGQSMKKSGGGSRYQKQFGGNRGTHSRIASNNDSKSNDDSEAMRLAARKRMRQEQGEEIDVKFGYARLEDQLAGSDSTDLVVRRGWLFHMLATTRIDKTTGEECSGLDLYFVGSEGTSNFKTTVLYRPYFYLCTKINPSNNRTPSGDDDEDDNNDENWSLQNWLMKRFGPMGLAVAQTVQMVDLDQPNHLSPNSATRTVWKLIFDNVSQLMEVRNSLRSHINEEKKKTNGQLAVDWTLASGLDNGSSSASARGEDPWTQCTELREYDVRYVERVCMDMDIRAGSWYTVTLDPTEMSPHPTLSDPDIETKADPTFLAFDIECAKAPLKFPSADVDEIYMISYMLNLPNGEPQGYLITSRTTVSQDIADFEYTPKPNYPGPFHIFNEVDERALLQRFVTEFQRHKPQIVVTYNGDFFDWPYVMARSKKYGIDIWLELGISPQGGGGGGDAEMRGRCCVHMDAFCWVQRDSYLPQGSQGLKAVTKYKLGYDPVDVDPEDMLPFAKERPVYMATYSVSDAVATYYLYQKYVHLFIFSLCTLIPMGPEDVLRKGSGTLCEALLMVQATEKRILCPNKQVDPLAKFHQGHLLESETYIGGKVECLETGVYRSDLEYDFDLKSSAFQHLIDKIDRDLSFAIEVEAGMDRKDIVNYDQIKAQIVLQLEMLRDRPKRREHPFVYHLDVGAMYPNIILTNRLQPSAMVDDATCAACDFNQAKNECKRKMDWVWRGDYTPALKSEYDSRKDQLSREVFQDGQKFHELPERDQAKLVAERLKIYSRNAYRKTKITEEITKKDVVCMRENDFYVETVRRFRDRRYDYKKLTKSWKKKIGGAPDAASRKEAEDKTLVYDSLQVAHKCILNSFYGYVMRKGARWRSMEMAGIVTKTGADLITQARVLVEQIGRPLELDTDGIWCILPKSFPDVYTFETHDGSKIKLEYPCVMLNADAHDTFTNHQYQTLTDPKRGTYETRSECSIFFEVDGPYRCMVLPAGTEEGQLLKKRYAVFNFDGSLAELKGFELKRRGELELIKTFQSQVFERFLHGESLEECYESVADVANHWIDVIDTRGESLDDEELFDLISENRNMSRQLDDYGTQKGTSQTTARRLGEFLGADIIKDKGLNCKFIIAEQPFGAPVTERAIPTAIWKSDPAVMTKYLRKWLKSPGLDGESFDIRNILDWDYYLERLGKTIQKIITIPAALQKVDNPVPRIPHPEWLQSKIQQLNDRFQQKTLKSMFAAAPTITSKKSASRLTDIEDIGAAKSQLTNKRPLVHSRKRRTTLANGNSSHMPAGEVLTLTEQDETPRVELKKTNFKLWLSQKKSQWKKSRIERKRALLEVDQQGRSATSTKRVRRNIASMEGFVRDAAQNLAELEWQIIEIRELAPREDDDADKSGGTSGEFIVWVLVGGDSMRKLQVSVPRTVYVATTREVECQNSDMISFKKVDKHLPHGKGSSFLYEISMPEYAYHNKSWIHSLQEVSTNKKSSDQLFDAVYESAMPLMTRALSELGCISKLNTNKNKSRKATKSYLLSDLKRIDRPKDGAYMNSSVSYKRCFLYVRQNVRARTGIVALYTTERGSESYNTPNSSKDSDENRSSEIPSESFNASSTCQLWIIKPGSRRSQKSVSTKQCETIFAELLQTIKDTADLESDYASLSAETLCQVSDLKFVEKEDQAYSALNESLGAFSKSGSGPTILVLNSSRATHQLRRYVPTLNSMPVIPVPFPPGPDHGASMSTLPALNWEQPAVQLCLEAYLYMVVTSFPKRVEYARYGNIPLGNLGLDENCAVFDVSLLRTLKKNRALSWASTHVGRPDLGISFHSSAQKSGCLPVFEAQADMVSQDEIWGDDDDLISPVVRRPGCYRSLCVDIDLQDLAIAALTDAVTRSMPGGVGNMQDATRGYFGSPNGVDELNGNDSGITAAMKTFEPLGDEMSMSVALPIIRSMVGVWLRDAFNLNSQVADTMLHHLYRLISSSDTLLHDPVLHRIVHSLMKSTFSRLLSELQRLGCSIVFATFHRITVATNKTTISDAEEYINFVISTIRAVDMENGTECGSLSRLALRTRQFHTHFLFLDEYNFGSMQLERIPKNEVEDTMHVIPDASADDSTTAVVASVVTAWSIINYLGNDISQEYFRIIVGRFSKDVLKKQTEVKQKEEETESLSIFSKEVTEQVLAYKRKMISKHFASYLTRAVGEILKDDGDVVNPEDDVKRQAMVQSQSTRLFTKPALDFIKSVMAILQLDNDVSKELHILKKSLLSQIGVAEYSSLAKWVNPCPKFILSDVFCSDCQDSRDVNLCYVPPDDDAESSANNIHWFCEECGTEYDTDEIQVRLVNYMNRKLMRYQLQDVRCSKTQRVSTSAMAKVSECSAPMKLDISRQVALSEFIVLKEIAEHHRLDELMYHVDAALAGYF